MTQYAVIATIGGFAREDAPVPVLVGAYTDLVVANRVKNLYGGGAQVVPYELDAISPGLRQSAEQMKINLPA